MTAGGILIIEGEPSLRQELTSALDKASFVAVAAANFPEALRKLADFKPDLVIMDEVLPDRDRIDACCQLRNNLGVPVVLIGSEESSDELWGRVMEAEADLYLVKPLRYWELVARVKAILRRCRRQGASETPASADLGKILKQRRVMIPMTLTELSSATGVSGSHLGRIENGERLPSGYVLRKIAKPLGFEEDELLILVGFKSPNPAEKVKVLSSKVDPYVAKLLSQEPVEMQRAAAAMLTFIKSVAVAKSIRSGYNIGFAEYVRRNYPQVDEDIITMVKDILEHPEGEVHDEVLGED